MPTTTSQLCLSICVLVFVMIAAQHSKCLSTMCCGGDNVIHKSCINGRMNMFTNYPGTISAQADSITYSTQELNLFLSICTFCHPPWALKEKPWGKYQSVCLLFLLETECPPHMAGQCVWRFLKGNGGPVSLPGCVISQGDWTLFWFITAS